MSIRATLLAVLALGAAAGAQGTRTAMPAPAQGGTIRGLIGGPDSIVVSVLTLGQGEELFDRFGHAAIRVRRPAIGLDSAWNWGMYDFASPHFIQRWLTGDTQYWMAGFPSPLFIDYYRRSGRAVWEQELALTRTEADSLLTVLRWNATEAHKFYRYDYYLDNCSTRVRDALDGVLHGALRRAMAVPGHDVSWRDETIRLAADFPLTAFGMTFALGKRADEKLSVWDEGFIPMRLRDALRTVTVPRAEGPRRLVAAERPLVPEGKFVEASSPAQSGLAWALLIGLAVAVVFELLGARASRLPAARWAFAALGGLFAFAAGMAGLLVLLAGTFTRHLFMGGNVHVLAATPATLALVVALPLAMRERASQRVRTVAAALGSFAGVAAFVGVVAHLLGAGSTRDYFPDLVIAAPTIALALALRRRARAGALA